ncbi:uncharacterized protein LOC130740445 [Lotus japonicus]|uniref:uncharacterized protein LOC130740445 n=1 Tax=Lotus japonicus TaxID=34305 RepID=UPI002590DABC|nr:uncharacterized protein LOC130740445 [Lotus japonicus]
MTFTRAQMENRMESVEKNVSEMMTVVDELRQLMLQQTRRRSRGRSRTPRRRHRSGSQHSSNSGDDSRSSRSVSLRHEDASPRRHIRTGRKIDLPVFNGDDAYGWIVRVERFFRLNEVDDTEKVRLLVVAMEERALNWFQWWEEQTPERTWEAFKEALVRRFQPGLVQNPFGPLLSIKQSGSVMEYRERFEMVAAPLRHTDRDIIKGIFLNGLKEEIRAELKLYRSGKLEEIMDRALLLEEKNLAMRNSKGGDEDKRGWKEKGVSSSKAHQTWIDGNKWKSQIAGSTTAEKSSADKSSTEAKTGENKGQEKKWTGGQRLSQSELQDRSRKGLCFKCGEKWNREHVCKMKHYQFVLMETVDEEEEEEDGQFF